MDVALHSDHVQLIPANEYRRVRWHNGAGWTREIATGPLEAVDGVSSAWHWRLSIAEIDRDGPFSTFEGVERECMLLHGQGAELQFENAPSQMLSPPFGRLRFPGEARLSAALVDGRVEVFNLMWRRERVQTSTWHRPLVGSMVVFVDPDSCWVVHVLAGHARLAGGTDGPVLSMGDTAILRAGELRTRHALEGGGELLLIRIEPEG